MLKIGDIVFVRKSAIHEFYGKIIRFSNIIIVEELEEYRCWHRLCYPSEVKELTILCA